MEKLVVHAAQESEKKSAVHMRFFPIIECNMVVSVSVSCVEPDGGPESAKKWSDGDCCIIDPWIMKLTCDHNF